MIAVRYSLITEMRLTCCNKIARVGLCLRDAAFIFAVYVTVDCMQTSYFCSVIVRVNGVHRVG